MYLVLSGPKRASDYRQGYSIPSYHVFVDDDDDYDDGDDDDDLDRQGKTIISATNNATHTFPALREGKIELWRVCR